MVSKQQLETGKINILEHFAKELKVGLLYSIKQQENRLILISWSELLSSLICLYM